MADDPWSGAGESTRAEVRDSFARHAATREAAESAARDERRSALPGFLRLPIRGWRGLPLAGKLAVAALGLVLAGPRWDSCLRGSSPRWCRRRSTPRTETNAPSVA